jgi:hypothetical protein
MKLYNFNGFINENNDLENLADMVNGLNFELALILSDHVNLKREVVQLILNKIVEHYFIYGFPLSVPLSYIVSNIQVEEFREEGDVLLVGMKIDYIEYRDEDYRKWVVDTIEDWFIRESGVRIELNEI